MTQSSNVTQAYIEIQYLRDLSVLDDDAYAVSVLDNVLETLLPLCEFSDEPDGIFITTNKEDKLCL